MVGYNCSKARKERGKERKGREERKGRKVKRKEKKGTTAIWLETMCKIAWRCYLALEYV